MGSLAPVRNIGLVELKMFSASEKGRETDFLFLNRTRCHYCNCIDGFDSVREWCPATWAEAVELKVFRTGLNPV
jgi:hypothetical protein